MLQEAQDMMKTIDTFNLAQEGDSGDSEIAAACQMRDAATAFMRSAASRNVELADALDEWEAENNASTEDVYEGRGACILTGTDGENTDDCATHGHEISQGLTCQRCGSILNTSGYCTDVTCPHSNHLQHETWTED
jgi:hypothetical protein